ncbi:MAG: 5-methylthioadenosine/S-adenosylhomocysteine nucleosidase [Thermoleophilia bacterium]|nr:5-methylthioadenosine/S-adenosylhomocysteine nucleosidase [Thermoleophilia bacterium]
MLLVVAATEGELRGVTGLRGVEALVCGVGPVDSGIAVAQRLARGPRPAALLHIGIAGTHSVAHAPVAGPVIGIRSIYADTTSPWVVRELVPPAALVAALRRVLVDAPEVTIATSADVAGSSPVLEASSLSCEVEAMEGFAVLRAAELAGIPGVEVRVIANEVAESDRSKWQIPAALEVLVALTPRLVDAVS